ncbi:MAG: phosphoribosylamine--glycine ligase [Candidatus Hydrogenedentes bacterium]|nr:phosphoribosylamine--glycine ligase [Candidatus Hydrogenedentota bacterium]
MKVLVIGSGGREHALCWKIAQSREVDCVYAVPGNPGINRLEKGKCLPGGVKDFTLIIEHIKREKIDLVVVGPEDPLAAGIVDELNKYGVPTFGPSAEASKLEASKSFAKELMRKHDIPTAKYAVFDDIESAKSYVKIHGVPIVIKADGLAGGKGVTVARDENSAISALEAVMTRKVFGDSGSKVVIEEFLNGEEASILAFSDGRNVLPLASSQDHKPVFDEDKGPNTGGMGAYSPAPVVTPETEEEISNKILTPTITAMAERGILFRGILYAGLMIVDSKPYVIEFNVRFGDPETQAILPRMKSDIVPLFWACIDGTLDKFTLEYYDIACVTIVLASRGYPGSYEKGMLITGIEEAERDPNVVVFHAGTSEKDGKLYTNGGRVLNVTSWDTNLKRATERAYSAVEKIHFDGMHYRKDIARKGLAKLGLL